MSEAKKQFEYELEIEVLNQSAKTVMYARKTVPSDNEYQIGDKVIEFDDLRESYFNKPILNEEGKIIKADGRGEYKVVCFPDGNPTRLRLSSYYIGDDESDKVKELFRKDNWEIWS